MQQYLELVQDVLANGVRKEDRTGVGTLSVFGRTLRFDLRNGFPLLTTKRVHFKSVVVELLMFLRGETNIKFLHQHGVTIWDEWAKPDGSLGPVYGSQWRNWNGEGIDQLRDVVRALVESPDSRRMVVSAWNPSRISDMALPPCHMAFQFYTRIDGDKRVVDLHVHQRSADIALGVPFNIASYALLLHIIAEYVGMAPGELVWTGGDCHVYLNHVEGLRRQVDRNPFRLPELTLALPELWAFSEIEPHHINITNYVYHEPIRFEVAV